MVREGVQVRCHALQNHACIRHPPLEVVVRSCIRIFCKNFSTRFFCKNVFCGVSELPSLRNTRKHDKKISEKINLTLVLFWPLTHPPTTGVTDFVLIGGPLILYLSYLPQLALVSISCVLCLVSCVCVLCLVPTTARGAKEKN
jgi:hypothetical protein